MSQSNVPLHHRFPPRHRRRCSNGESCVFAHGEHELRGQRGPGAARAAALDPEQEAMAWLKAPPPPRMRGILRGR